MTARFLATALVTVVLAVSPAIAQAGQAGDATAFTGHWRVTGVAVSDQGVQALADNDPSFMGKGLTFSPTGIAWDQPPATHDVCANPRLTRLGTPAPADLRPQLRKLGLPRPPSFAIQCQSGSWGPGSSAHIFRGAGGVLGMPWYDGGVLRLVRQ